MEILLSTVINFFKIATFVVYIYCIVAYNLWDSYAAWLLLATHGTYGLLWTSKTWFGYSDKNFEVKAPLYYLFATAIVLTLYWLPMAMIVQYRPVLHPPVAALVVALFGWGVYFHFAADLHKTVFIQQRGVLQNIEQTLKQGNNKDMSNIFPKVTFLRSNLFAISRNPNYFGELLIYLSFALCSMHIYPLIYLLVVIAVVWFPNMRKKDASLSRFGDEYANYSRNTAKLIPFVW
jgi:steroid 5-alpha reductase family enzyme